MTGVGTWRCQVHCISLCIFASGSLAGPCSHSLYARGSTWNMSVVFDIGGSGAGPFSLAGEAWCYGQVEHSLENQAWSRGT